MAKTKVSRSAEGVAGMRAIEMRKPEADRIVSDPYADALIPGGVMFAISLWIIESGLYERMAPGAVGFIIGRERYIDEYLKMQLSEGIDQVVILGAGFDTRAYRIPGIERTRVFEIDQPATQAVKLERLKKVIDLCPPTSPSSRPISIPNNSARSCRAEATTSRARLLFIWQGVTYFLNPEGIDSTLAFIVGHSEQDSAVVFDYIYKEILRDTTQGYGKTLARAGKISGEPYVFGIDKGQVRPFLAQRGFCDVIDMPLEDVKTKYFTGPNAARAIDIGHIAIASARVCKAKS